ncbi:MAG: MBL fold metallo-hydrolase, partial [Verrucomicrobiales bacterium]|nr:MBL fold metallo-hydrolase [Verrucomicrobiales bacterium]
MEIDLRNPETVAIYVQVHAPELMLDKTTTNFADIGQEWLDGLSEAEMETLLERSKEFVDQTIRIRMNKNPELNLNLGFPFSFEKSDDPNAPGSLVATMRFPNPGEKISIALSEKSEKRMLVAINRSGEFPEARDLEAGESFELELPENPNPPPDSTGFGIKLLLVPVAVFGLIAILRLVILGVMKNRAALFLLFASGSLFGQELLFEANPAVNSVGIRLVDGRKAAFNRGWNNPDALFLTHSRRDIVEHARAAAGESTEIFAPEESKDTLEGAEQHWQDWWEKRFDYYGQQVTKLPLRNFPAKTYLKDGEEIDWQGLKIRVLETPGYTRDGLTYLVELDGNTMAITGDLIYEGGQVFDLYSFQDAIPEAKIGSYHGYGARMATWIASLEKLAA